MPTSFTCSSILPSIIAAFSDKGSVGAVAYLEQLNLGLCIIAESLIETRSVSVNVEFP
jgi:hypothetical protein